MFRTSLLVYILVIHLSLFLLIEPSKAVPTPSDDHKQTQLSFNDLDLASIDLDLFFPGEL